MLAILEFIFSSFWVWLGTVVLIIAAGIGLSTMFSIEIRREDD